MKQFFDNMVQIENVVQGNPESVAVDTFASIIKRSLPLARHGFKSLQRDDWLKPLQERGVFSNAFFNSRKSKTSEWPPLCYLCHIVRNGSTPVQAISLDILLNATDFLSSHYIGIISETMLDAPLNLAKRWAKKEIKRIKQSKLLDGSLYGEKFADLAVFFASNDEIDLAVQIFETLFKILSDSEQNVADINNVSKDEYELILEKHVPHLITLCPKRAFEFLNTVLLNLHSEPEFIDLLSINRPAIEDHEQNTDFHPFENHLISAWRDSAEVFVKHYPDQFGSILSDIESHEKDIFNRLALHLLRVFGNDNILFVEQHLANKSLFNNLRLHHELWNLLHHWFKDISLGAQKSVLQIIEEGPDLPELDTAEPKFRENRRRYGQYLWLLAIEDSLNEAWITRLAKLRDEFGEPAMPPDFLSWTGKAQFVTTKSPVSQDEISSKSIPELLGYLKTWRSAGNHSAPSPAGLGSELSALVQAAPEKWAADLEHFQDFDLDPTYQRFLISGYQALVQSDKPIPWKPVLAFCKWIVDQDPVVPGRQLPDRSIDGFEADRTRMQSRMEIARLLDKALPAKNEVNPPISLKNQIWQIIEPLTLDTNPSLEDEKQDISGGISNALSRSLNTVRGEALHAMMQYALWVYRDLDAQRKARNAETAITFDHMPEIRKALDRRFSNDPECWYSNSTTDRAVMGQWLPQLVHLDPDWVRSHIKDLYPKASNKAHLKNAFWNTYLCYSKLFGNVYDVLQDVYLKAVKSLSEHTLGDHDENPSVRLAQQVMILYMWEKVNLADDGLVHAFFTHAHPDITGKAIAFAGHTLEDQHHEIPDEIIPRLRDLWDWRVKISGVIDKVPVQERNAFCFWFASGRFDLKWSMLFMKEGLKEWHGLRWGEDRVLQQLVRVFNQVPRDALQCLRLMVERTDSSWFFTPSETKPTWQLLDQGLGHSDPAVRNEAESIINHLGEMGYLGYRPLWEKHRKKG